MALLAQLTLIISGLLVLLFVACNHRAAANLLQFGSGLLELYQQWHRYHSRVVQVVLEPIPESTSRRPVDTVAGFPGMDEKERTSQPLSSMR
jgi:hypothetical protein